MPGKYVPPHLRGQSENGVSSSSGGGGDKMAHDDGRDSRRWSGSGRSLDRERGPDRRMGSSRWSNEGGEADRERGSDRRIGSSRWSNEGGEAGSANSWNRIRENRQQQQPSSSRQQEQGWRPGAQEQGKKEESQPQSEEERLAAEKERHPDMFSEETVALQDFYTEHSEVFRSWADCRSRGYTNKYIAHFFEKKKSVKDSKSKRGGAHEGADIRPIFTQFFKYAIDIDLGLAYTERARDIAIAQGSCWFLDFGFAPGGMADLLLEAHPAVKGVGFTLEPKLGGNVHLDKLNSHDRFWIHMGDVILRARDDLDLKAACNLPDDFDGFDFVIIGITIHQEWEGENMNELKDLLHFSQLYFAIKYCKPGAMVMMRMHMSVRLVDAHFLSLMLSLFKIEKFTGVDVGRRRIEETALEEKQAEKLQQVQPPAPPQSTTVDQQQQPRKSKLDMLCEKVESQKLEERKVAKHYAWTHLDKTAVATKPFSTFSMRKTYWVIYHGFDCDEDRRKELMEVLQILIGEDVFAYGWDDENKSFRKPILMKGSIHEILQAHGKQMISVLEDVWSKQVLSLEGFMAGLTDKFCREGINCRRRYCNMAHTQKDMIPQVLDALYAVDQRAQPRLSQLTSLGYL